MGTYNPTISLGAITDCYACDEGWYCLEETNAPRGKCVIGYYCPTNITNPYATTPELIGSYGPEQVGGWLDHVILFIESIIKNFEMTVPLKMRI